MQCSLAPQNFRFALQLCLLPLISRSPILLLSIYSIIASPYCSSFSHTSFPFPPLTSCPSSLSPSLPPTSPNFLLCVLLIYPIIASLLFLFSYTRHFPSLPFPSLPSSVPLLFLPASLPAFHPASIPISGPTLFPPASTQFERCVQDVLLQ